MNLDQCANCLFHGWTEVEDQSTLQRCKRCKFIKYCGRECQTEHWLKVHYKHCKYFADPVKAQKWEHKEVDCVICRQSAAVGINQLRRPDNPYYGCIYGQAQIDDFPPHYLHPHPFPATGVPSDTFEKSIIILWKLLHKFQLTQPGVVASCSWDFGEVISQLRWSRLGIWLDRKISPKPQLQSFQSIKIDLSSIEDKVGGVQLSPDPFQLWKIILLVKKISRDVSVSQKLNQLINPLADTPAEFHENVKRGVINSTKYLATANEVLDALATQLIPYRDVVSIICGGSREKACSFCSKQITITDVTSGGLLTGPFAQFGFVHTTMYCCDSNYCLQKSNSVQEEFSQTGAAMIAAETERGRNWCDFCLKFPARADVHRCSKCLSVMYCSTDCRDQDWDIHKKVCKEDVEERKKKFGRSARRKEGKDAIEGFKKRLESIHVEESAVPIQKVSEVVGKFKVKNSAKKSDK